MSDTESTPTQPENSSSETSPPKQKRGRGPAIRRLRKASSRTISENSEEIAKALLKHTLDGNVNCAKLLLTLLERTSAENEKRQKNRPTLASQLEAEPQWDPSQRRDGPLVITRRLIMTNND